MEAREDRWAAAMRAALGGDGAAYERLLGEVAAMVRRMNEPGYVVVGYGAAILLMSALGAVAGRRVLA